MIAEVHNTEGPGPFKQLALWEPEFIRSVAGSIVLVLVATAALSLLGPIFGVLFLLAPVAFAFAWRMPGGVLAAYLYIPFYKGSVEEYLPVDLTAVLAILACILGVPLLLDKKKRLPFGAFAISGVLLFISTLGVFFAPDTQLATVGLLYFSLLIFPQSLLVIRVARDRRLLEQFLAATLLLSALVALAGLVQIGTLGFNERLEPLSNTIGTARSSLFLLLVAPVLVRTSLRCLAWAGVALSPLGILVAVASGSRGPLLMAIVTVVGMSLLLRKQIIRKSILGVLALLFGFLALQTPQIQKLIPGQSLWRIEKLWSAATGSGELDASSMGRVHLFGIAQDMFRNHPIFGMGTASFEYVTRSLPGLSDQTYPHNLLLQFAAEFGLLGLCVVLLVMSYSFVHALGSIGDPLVRAVFTLGVFAVLNSMVSNGIYDNRWLWGMLIMLAALPVSQWSACDREAGHSRSGVRL